ALISTFACQSLTACTMAMTEISDDGASTADIFREGFSMDSLEEELMSMGIGATTASKLVKYFQLSFSARYPNVKHSRGLLLYGPQDDDKILIAQSILKIVKAKETLTLSGQEVMNDSQGYCWDKINSLCNAAREEEKRYGYRSGLYFVIVDEVDVIGKRREENSKFIYELFALLAWPRDTLSSAIASIVGRAGNRMSSESPLKFLASSLHCPSLLSQKGKEKKSFTDNCYTALEKWVVQAAAVARESTWDTFDASSGL
ncbi:hypothetical protein RJ640_005956, partial [Escallonia rubra]